MNKVTTMIAVLTLALCLSACTAKTYEDGYAEGYSDGLFDGKISGYDEGIGEAQHDIAFRVDDDLSTLASDIEETYGIHPEEAMQILANYADDPEAISEEELYTAIWALDSYFYRSQEVINDIENYWID